MAENRFLSTVQRKSLRIVLLCVKLDCFEIISCELLSFWKRGRKINDPMRDHFSLQTFRM